MISSIHRHSNTTATANQSSYFGKVPTYHKFSVVLPVQVESAGLEKFHEISGTDHGFHFQPTEHFYLDATLELQMHKHNRWYHPQISPKRQQKFSPILTTPEQSVTFSIV